MLGNQVTALLLTGSMVIRLTMIVVAAGLLLAGLSSPVNAGGLEVKVSHYPAADDQIAVRQAYMSWLAAKQEAGMEATIRYIYGIDGATETLIVLRERFHETARLIPERGSGEELDNLILDFRDLTRKFRDETRIQIISVQGNRDVLTAAVHAAVDGDNRTQMFEDEYWMTRKVTEPASFKRYIRESQAMLSVLQEHGYEVIQAQERLDQIEAMRSDYSTALQSQDYGGAEAAREKIHDAAVGFEEIVKGISNVKNSTSYGFSIPLSGG